MNSSVVEDSYNLLEYLSAVSREVGTAPVRDVGKHQDVVWPGSLPDHPAITYSTPHDDTKRLRIARVPEPERLPVPRDLQELVGRTDVADPDYRFEYISQRVAELVASEANRRFDLSQAAPSENKDDWIASRKAKLRDSFDQWHDKTFIPWREKTEPVVKVRKLYRTLHQLHHDMVAESATHEVVWGEIVLSYRTGDGQTVRAPLLTTPVSLEIDAADASIVVTSEHSFELELDCIEGTDLDGLTSLSALRQKIRENPPLLGDPEERLAVRRELVSPMGVNAELTSSEDPASPSSAPQLNDGWVLYKRPRPMRQERFYDELAHKIQDENFVPEALASIVADNDRVDETLRELGSEPQRDDGTSDRLMMPLPSNQEQERIARQLATSRGVTVQGPPGTGKSHTIVNLISHLVAQGKRVLVTAEKEQALSVLRGKIPEELRDLSISVLGSTPAALEELKSAVQSTQDSLSSLDLPSEHLRIDELEQRIDELRDESQRLDRTLVDALASEEQTYHLPTGATRAPDVAMWLSDNATPFALQDELDRDAAFPLSRSEYEELIHDLQQISAEDAREALKDLPTGTWIPSDAEFRSLHERLDALQTRVTSLEDQGARLDAFESMTREDLRKEADDLRRWAEHALRLDGMWENQFGEALAARNSLALWVVQNNSDIRDKLAAAQEMETQLTGNDIKVPEGDPTVQLAQLQRWSERLQAGKKLGLLGPKDLKELDSQVTVNGYPVSTAAQVDLVAWKVRQQSVLAEVQRLAQQVYGQAQIPIPDQDGLLWNGAQRAERIEQLRAWWGEQKPHVEQRLAEFITGPRPIANAQTLSNTALLLEDAAARLDERELSRELDKYDQQLAEASRRDDASDLWGRLLTARQHADAPAWANVLAEARRLQDVRARVLKCQDHLRSLRSAGAEGWARTLHEERASAASEPNFDEAKHAWEWTKARTWLTSLHTATDISGLMRQSRRVADALESAIVETAGRSAMVGLKENLKDRQRRALDEWLSANKKLGKGTGKNAPRYRAAAREALPEAMGAMPVWIMPIHRVLENFDPRVTDMFDVVIVDESSQCDLLTLGVLALGRKSVVVGDDKQTSPQRVGVNTDRINELQDQYLGGMPGSKLLTVDASLYALAGRIFPSTIALKEHFRCVPDIIEFSNRYYDGNIFPLREVSAPQIGPAVQAFQVPDAVSEKVGSQRVNLTEAEAIADHIALCTEDPAYDGMTFGVVVMMSGPQSEHLQSKIRDRIGDEEFETRKMRVGTPPHFQGDERNVVFISMVTHENSYAFTREQHAQWINVAASRAQDQLCVFYSMDPAALNHNDERRHLIYYAQDRNGPGQNKNLYELTDSKFEKDVLRDLLERGYTVKPQHRVGNYRLDFAVQVASGEKIAVECDGDTFHGPEHWDQDVQRQRVLERLGWTFWRIRASQYYYDRQAAMQPLWGMLGELEQAAKERAEIHAMQADKFEQHRLETARAELAEAHPADR